MREKRNRPTVEHQRPVWGDASQGESESLWLAFEDVEGADGVAGLTVASGVALADALHDIHAADDAPEDAVFAIEVGRGAKGDEELGAVGIGAGIGHGEDASTVVLEGERASFVVKFVAGAAGACASWVATLGHEVADDAVEGCAVVEALAREEDASLTLNVSMA